MPTRQYIIVVMNQSIGVVGANDRGRPEVSTGAVGAPEFHPFAREDCVRSLSHPYERTRHGNIPKSVEEHEQNMFTSRGGRSISNEGGPLPATRRQHAPR
eukprot:12886155-Prorocentrum_lima.AAC.1